MKKAIFFCFTALLLLSGPLWAATINFYFIYPGGEGSTTDAQPYLAELFTYLKDTTGLDFEGTYINSESDGEAVFKNQTIHLAIVSPDFFAKYQKKLGLTPALKTIPSYASGPFEKYYIMTHIDTDLTSLTSSEKPVSLLSAKKYENRFLTEVIFSGNDIIKKIPWNMTETPNILETIKLIAQGEMNTFVLLTGYEFSVIYKLKKSNPDFAKLKLVFSSMELPSSSLVSVDKTPTPEMAVITKALMGMDSTLKGNVILKNLRLTGFAQ